MSKFKKHSWQTVLYKYFWNTNKLPDNLCPYFWKLVVMYILIIPYAIISFPYHAINYFLHEDLRDELPPIIVAFMGSLIYFILSMIISMILIWFYSAIDLIQVLGIVGYTLSFALLIGWGVRVYKKRKLKQYRKNFELGKEFKPSRCTVAAEFIKAKYNKHCPKIEWI